MSKNLFHSELVRISPVTVSVVTDVLNSKYKGKPPYVVLEIDGEARNYTTENDACAEFFYDRKGTDITIAATGSRGEAAIDLADQAAGDRRAPARPQPRQQDRQQPQQQRQPERQPEQRQLARRPEPPPMAEEDVAGEATRLANVWLAAHTAADYAKRYLASMDVAVTEAMFQACTSSIYIQLVRDGLHKAMPVEELQYDEQPKSDTGKK